MNTIFETIGIVVKPTEAAINSAKKLVNLLFKHNRKIICEHSTVQHLPECKILGSCDLTLLATKCDLIIIIGGDGIFLKTARLIATENIPLLGINQGSFGFLTDIKPTQIESKITEILSGKYITETRFLLGTYLKKNDTIEEKFSALNEITIISDNPSHMLEFEIYINNIFLCSQKSNGVIIATPTGSTAYALSGGGPIVYPTLNVITIVPMFPHTLSLRPIIIDNKDIIDVIVCKNCKYKAVVYGDSQSSIEINSNTAIRIQKISTKLQLIHPNDYDYFNTLRHKFGWGRKAQEEVYEA